MFLVLIFTDSTRYYVQIMARTGMKHREEKRGTGQGQNGLRSKRSRAIEKNVFASIGENEKSRSET
jgi:hypothetical protein